MRTALAIVLAVGLVTAAAAAGNPRVALKTTKGTIVLELYPDKAPRTVENFLRYVREGFYEGTVFHRVIPGFVIQGGGLTPDLRPKPTRAPIPNEAKNGLSNRRGTVAMARTMVVDSATSQFFVNLADNTFLDHRNETPQGYGYAVFGRVVEGMDVVDAIAAVPTGTVKGFRDVPKEAVVIESAEVLPMGPGTNP
ncbi:MAG: peptidyl-prolyl cis-trans isomerase [Deltaproteobacteria bacterium]|nr:peptidyl-prolyl cis-trans isomerase [Deltaproteobacteria bacterium]